MIGRIDEAIAVLTRCFELRAEAGEIHETTRATRTGSGVLMSLREASLPSRPAGSSEPGRCRMSRGRVNTGGS